MKFKDALEFKEELIEKELVGELNVETIFSCNHCKRPAGWDELEGINQHLESCLFKDANKRCLMCKHLKIIEEAPYPKNNKLWKSVDTEWGFGSYRTPICMKSDNELSEREIHSYHEECFELGTDMPIIERSEEYIKWVELSEDAHEEYTTETKDE